MTFADIYKTVAKETGYPRKIVEDILLGSIRVVLEELMSDREHATITIRGFIEIFLQKRHYRMYSRILKDFREFDRWVIFIKPQKRFKQLINEEMDIHNFIIGRTLPLYPEEYYKTHTKKSKKPLNEFFETLPVNYKIVDTNRAKRKKLKKKTIKQQQQDIKNKLPQED